MESISYSSKISQSQFPKTFELMERLELQGYKVSISNLMFDSSKAPKYGDQIDEESGARKSIMNPSQNVFRNRGGDAINSILVHTTSWKTTQTSLKTYHEYGVSANFFIDAEGIINLLVPIEYAAFHAGPSKFANLSEKAGLNDCSIGIEFLTPECVDITQKQQESYKNLLKSINQVTNAINPVVSHESVAPARKSDPGFFAINSIINITNEVGNEYLPKNDLEAANKIASVFQSYCKGENIDYTSLYAIISSLGYRIDEKPEAIKGVIYDYTKMYAHQKFIEGMGCNSENDLYQKFYSATAKSEFNNEEIKYIDVQMKQNFMDRCK